MAYETKELTGSIFKNDRRDKETQPHGKGKCMIGGVLYWISAWTNEGAKGRYQSLKFEVVKDQQQQPKSAGAGFIPPPRPPKEPVTSPIGDDHFQDADIPF